MLINLTPHSVTIRKPDDTVITIPPSGSIARVESFEEPRPDTEGIPTIRRMWGGDQSWHHDRSGEHLYRVNSCARRSTR